MRIATIPSFIVIAAVVAAGSVPEALAKGHDPDLYPPVPSVSRSVAIPKKNPNAQPAVPPAGSDRAGKKSKTHKSGLTADGERALDGPGGDGGGGERALDGPSGDGGGDGGGGERELPERTVGGDGGPDRVPQPE